MKQTDNPFEGLGIRYPQVKYGDGSIKQKAFFENGSYESDLVPLEDRIITLAGFVYEGYDVNGNQECSDFGNQECSVFGNNNAVKTATMLQ